MFKGLSGFLFAVLTISLPAGSALADRYQSLHDKLAVQITAPFADKGPVTLQSYSGEKCRGRIETEDFYGVSGMMEIYYDTVSDVAVGWSTQGKPVISMRGTCTYPPANRSKQACGRMLLYPSQGPVAEEVAKTFRRLADLCHN